MPKFEVAIYNAQVRAKVRVGERHRDLSDDWAETHYVVFDAADEAEARSLAERKYPEERGYVIEAVDPALE
jgi:hypothetical protein